MKKSAIILQQRAQKIESQKALHATAEGEKRSLNETETATFRSLQAEIEGLTGQYNDALAYEENLRSMEGSEGTGFEGEGESAKKKKPAQRAYSLAAHIRGAMGGKLTGAEKEAQEKGIAEREARGLEINEKAVYIPEALMSRATQQTVTQDAGEYGGQLVSDAAPRLIDGFMPKLFLEDMGANVWTGLSGGDIPLPVSSNYTFEWLEEGEAITGQKQKFVGPKLSPKRAGALVSITKKLLMQSSIDVEATIRKRLQDGIRRTLEGVAIQGLAANNEPVGILNTVGVAASTNQVAAGAATYANVVELQGLVEDADATEISLGYLCNPKLRAKMKTISKGTDMGGAICQNGLIDGMPTVSTSLVKKISGTPDTYPLIYGDFSQLYVGIWGGIEIIVDAVSTEAASKASVNLIINMEADVQIAHPAAFAKNNFMTA
jgi:HK97 family phage major capsid protein